jgi:hypothetical protein
VIENFNLPATLLLNSSIIARNPLDSHRHPDARNNLGQQLVNQYSISTCSPKEVCGFVL